MEIKAPDECLREFLHFINLHLACYDAKFELNHYLACND